MPLASLPPVDFPRVARATWELLAAECGDPAKLVRRTDEGLQVRPLYDASDWPGAGDASGLPGAPPFTRGFTSGARGWQVRCEHAHLDPEALRRDVAQGADGIHVGWEAFHAALAMVDPGRVAVSTDAPDRRSILDAMERSPRARPARACGRAWHEAGADAALELGIVLSSALGWLRSLTGAGLDTQRAAAALELSVAVDCDLYLSVAKLRALRRCWGRALEVVGLDPAAAPPLLHARTSARMLSRRDPWTNALRATIAAVAAATGGADAITVLPFDHLLGEPSERARRLARNTGLVLREEARLHLVQDPWGGSFALERLSEDLARAAWQALQELERRDAAKGAEWIRERCAAAAAARAKRAARRQDTLVGVSDFALAGEPPDRAQAALDPQLIRPAAPWEALWLRCEAHRARTGALPRVFLAALGPLAERHARTTWVANLLAAAGLDLSCAPDEGWTDPAQMAAASRASGARAVVVCGADARYPALGEEVARGLRAAGASLVLQAGAPGEREAAWRAAGVDEFLVAGQDVLAAMERLLAGLGVA